VDFSEDSILAFEAAAKLAGFFHAGLLVIHVIEPTPAATEIINYARNLGVDIAVIGAKGVRLLEEAVIGGTTEHVVKRAGCSVLVVKD
jgi:nucleotide-binding universal stress UspA family protein